MAITVVCACGKTLTAPDEAAGQRVKCPACGVILNVDAPTFAERMTGRREPRTTPVAATAEPTFAAEAVTAFVYPLSIRGILAMLGAALIFSLCLVIIARLPWPASIRAVVILYVLVVAVAAYLFGYLADIVRSSATGGRETPDWPDLTEFAPTFWWIIYPLAVLFFAPIVLIVLIAGSNISHVNPVVFTAVFALGCVYLPMALVGTLLLRSFLAVSPHLVVPAALRAWPGVLLSAGLLWLATTGWGAINARMAAWAAQRGSLIAPLVGQFAADLALVYLLLVAARVAGVSYYVRRREIGWFERM